jgi:hypothetical protein
MPEDELLSYIGSLQRESANLRNWYEGRWQRNIKLKKGIPLEDKTTRSDVRNRNKQYYRKIWGTSWRLAASFYSAYLRDPDQYKIEGRDTETDPTKAKALGFMTQYRIDKMNRESYLFLKHIWAIMDAIDYGMCAAQLSWEYNPELKKDGPAYTIYPVEQVYMDLAAETPDQMRWVIFEDFMSKEQMKLMGYENIDDAQAEGVPSNPVRQARMFPAKDPIQNPGPKEYPTGGTYEDDRQDDIASNVYRVWKCFYKKDGKIKFCVTNKDTAILKEEVDSPYGDMFPLVYGTCLTEAHKMIGEGFAEPMEAFQESYNYTLNQRKDNIALLLSRPTVVSRYGNVDLNSLVNRAAGKAIMADDPSAIKEMEMGDFTASAYRDAAVDENNMRDLSGVTSSLEGAGDAGTATGDQINLSQGNAKIELYLAIFGQTYFKSFYSLLAYYIQRFETDANVFRVANTKLNAEGLPGIDKIDDFDADVVVNVGMAYVGREQTIRQTLLVMDRAAVYNAAQIQLLQSGAVPPTGVQLINSTEFVRDLLPLLGKKDFSKYFVNIQPPPTPAQSMAGAITGGGPQAEAMAGAGAPQIGGRGMDIPQNDMQAGSMGGF